MMSNVKCQMSNVKRGVTLIELLLYMAIMSIFLLTLTDIFVSIVNVRLEGEATSAVEQDGRYIVSRLAYDINRASLVLAPGTYGSPGTNTLSIDIAGTTYTYSLSGSNFQLVNDLGANNLNSSESKVSNINFQKIGNSGGKNTIKLSFTVTSVTERPSGPESKTF